MKQELKFKTRFVQLIILTEVNQAELILFDFDYIWNVMKLHKILYQLLSNINF